MERIAIDDVEPNAYNRDIDRRALSEPLNTSDVAVNYYRLEPGERFSGGLHTHMDQEEIFLIVEGQATFETKTEEVSVESGEAIRFAPGDFQSGKNDGESELIAYALGGPRDSEDVRVPQACPDCGHDNMRAVPADEGFDLVCPECGTELEGD